MSRTILFSFLSFAIISTFVRAQTVIPGGPVTGTWNAEGSPYLIEGEICILDGQSLTIEPGVEVIFQGHYKLVVNGILEAIGTASDSIVFTAVDSSIGWHSIRFIDAADNNELCYCTIQYGQANAGTTDEKSGGGIFCSNSNPVISHCQIISNYASYCGGGIYCADNSNPVISDCLIAGNEADPAG